MRMPDRAQVARWAPMAIVLLAAALRVYRLGQESLWFDEGWSAQVARESWPTLRSILLTQPFPLYYALLNMWAHLGESEFMLRLISAISGTASVAMLYVVVAETMDRPRARWAALLLAISPLHIWYSQEARMYALGMFLSLASTWALLAARRRRGWVRWGGYALLSAAALYSFYYAAFIIVCHGLYMAFLAWQARGAGADAPPEAPAAQGPARQSSAPLVKWLTSAAVTLLLFLPGLFVLIRQLTGGTWSWLAGKYGRPGAGDLVATALAFSLGDTWSGPSFLRWVGMAAFALAFAAAIGQLRVDRGRLAYALRLDAGTLLWALCLCLPIGAIFVVSQLWPAYLTRYLVLFLPAYCAIIGKGLAALRPRALAALALLCIVATTALSLGTLYGQPQKEEWRFVAQVIEGEAAPWDQVLLVDEDASAVLQYYLRDALPVKGVSGAVREPAELASVVDQAGPAPGRIWLVESHTTNRALYRYLRDSATFQLEREWSVIGIELALFGRVR